jgi:hypothetical protein
MVRPIMDRRLCLRRHLSPERIPAADAHARDKQLYQLARDGLTAFESSCRTDKAELARHKVGVLLPDELHNLGQWDYPFVFERSRFHLDQSGRVEARAASMTQGKAVA